MPTTSNFGWTTPADTDLVKDGAAAIRTLGNGIDTSFVDLKGGTTGQVLAKASNTDLDFTWATDASGIPATIFDAKGDLIAASAADTAARLAVGANGTVLTADSAEATGLKWATASSGPTGWSLLNAGGTALTGAATITISSISAKQLLILVQGASSANASSSITLRINGDTAANYSSFGIYNSINTSYAATFLQPTGSYSNATSISIGTMGNNAASAVSGSVFIDLADQTGWKRHSTVGSANAGGGAQDYEQFITQGFYEGSAAITSISIISSTGNFDAGTLYVLGAN